MKKVHSIRVAHSGYKLNRDLYPRARSRGDVNKAILGMMGSLGISGFEKCMFFLSDRMFGGI